MSKLIQLFIKIYQLCLSPFLGANCRYLPTCSEYAKECFEHHTLWRASYLSLKRISRCHPYCEGGYDPPPKS